MSRNKPSILFLPDNRKIEFEAGKTIYEAALEGGIFINSICGGAGKCGKCKVRLSGEFKKLTLDDESFLDAEERAEGFWLACRASIIGDVTVEIPPESRLAVHKILSRSEAVKLKKIEPLAKKIYLVLSPPSLTDNTSDLERLERAIENLYPSYCCDISKALLGNLASKLRKSQWRPTVTIGKFGERHCNIIEVEPDNTETQNYGLAIDIGTTTVVVNLIDIETGDILETEASYNKQLTCGEDVLSRISFTEEKSEGLAVLNRLVLETLNELIANILKKRNLSQNSIYSAAVAGNTTMIHLFLGIDPKQIRYEPYIPTVSMPPRYHAKELGLDIHPDGVVYILPSRSSYVGADITADILASELHLQNRLALLIDVGTNGEVVLGNSDWMIGCSCSAGPAFEGGEVGNGMRAAIGAIEKFELTEELEPKYSVIGTVKPIGICGSGLIDVLAELFLHGIIDKAGMFTDIKSERLRDGAEGKEFVLVDASDSGSKKAIVITQPDIKNILRTKAAVFAAVTTLLNTVGFKLENIERIYIAGGFGNYLDIEKAILLGIFPDVPIWKYRFLGNGAVAGARLALLSAEKRKEAEEIYRRLTYLELSVNPMFMNEFTSALFIPHTNTELFPTAKKFIA